jgi:hypothetical protein
MPNPIIAVIGGNYPAEKDMKLAEEVGRELAARGATVVCGGLGGVMEAVCRGAKEAGGVTIGILPGSDPDVANQWVDYPICTGMGYARNVIVVRASRAVIAIDGAYGTLSEIGHALGDSIPTIGLFTWDISINGQPDTSIIRANSAVEAVDLALTAALQPKPE